jgi:hypothetical protein
MSLIFKKFLEAAMLKGNRQKMPEICGDTVDDSLRGVALFTIGWKPCGKCAQWVSLLVEHFLKKSVSVTLKALLNRSPIPWSFPKKSPVPFR